VSRPKHGGAGTIRRLTAGILLAIAVAPPSVRALSITRGPLIQNPDASTGTMTIEWWTDTAGDSTVE